MVSMDQSIISLYQKGEITEETAMMFAANAEQVKRRLGR
jgi:twitching motility protein PilT